MNPPAYYWKGRLILAMIIAAALLLVMGLVWLSHASLVKANTTDLANFEAVYPKDAGSAIDTCTLCHTSPPSLNAYGAAYLAAGRNQTALTAIENLDSDGDGWTNIQEINAVPPTFPGDPNSHPAAAPTATATSGPTNPPTPTNTTGPTSTMGPTSTPGPVTGPGGPTPTKIRRPTEVEPTEKEPTEVKPTEVETSEPTEIEPTESEGHGTKTPETTKVEQVTRTPESTEEGPRMTRTPFPTKVCYTPTPGGPTPGGQNPPGGPHDDGGGWWDPCGSHYGGDSFKPGSSQTSSFFKDAWSGLVRFFRRR